MDIGTKEWKTLIIDGAREFGITVRPYQAHLFARHAATLLHWNRKMNLTSIVNPVDMAVKHYLDSIIPVSQIKSNASLLDVGSGAGFPGLPLKIMLPSLQVTFLDAKRKKVNFLRHVIQTMDLKHTVAEQARFETLTHNAAKRKTFDVLVSRAFSSLERLVNGAVPLLSKDGIIIALKGTDIEKELQGRTRGHTHSDWVVPTDKGETICLEMELKRFSLPILDVSRTLIVFRRRPGPSM